MNIVDNFDSYFDSFDGNFAFDKMNMMSYKNYILEKSKLDHTYAFLFLKEYYHNVSQRVVRHQ